MKKSFLLLLILSLLLIASPARAEFKDVYGFAWVGADDATGGATEPVGWVSFDSDNPEISCDKTSYGVQVDYSTGEIRGEAFIGVGEDRDYNDCTDGEDSVGWLDFYYNDSNPPWGGELAHIDNKKIKGGAPIMSDKDNDDLSEIVSWVRFDGDEHSSEIQGSGRVGTPGNNTDHYAWAGGTGDDTGTTLGWIDLNPALDNAAVSTTTTVKFPEDYPPTANSLEIDYQDYCNVSESAGDGNVAYKWLYTDAEGDEEGAFDFQVDNNSDFSSPVINREVDGLSNPSGTEHTQNTYVIVGGGDNELSYNTRYYWRVKVYDTQGNSSEWTEGPSFETTAHPWPYPSFDVQPETPETGTEVDFIDNSVCYDDSLENDDCADMTNTTYEWDFDGDGVVESYKKGNATYTYEVVDEYEAKLTVSDNVGSCATTKTLMATLPLPEWEEVGSE